MMLYFGWDQIQNKITVGRASTLREESKGSVPQSMIAHVSLWLRP